MKIISFRNDVLPLKNQLYRLALRITLDSAEAEDIVQETMIKVWDRRETWQEIESIEAFCFTVCRNLALDSIKRHGSQNDSLDEHDTDSPDQSLDPYEQMLRNDRVDVVRKLVDELPEKQRSCMQLRDFEGKSYKDIASVLGITEEQVKVNIYRARQAIKVKFQEIDNYGL
uniref:RNA polymerase sigma factor n=2 Tax=unclassified Prevotella TaxID=2638335 RepID=A0AB33JL97_9BACT